MTNIILVAVALLPVIVLCTFVFIKDKTEKEPIGLLLKLLLFGALTCIPAAIIEIILGKIILGIVPFGGYAYYAADAFIGVALVEEGVKLAVLVLFTRKNKEFNCIFDGLIYAVFVSLGFAALENILYVLQNGLAVGIMRAVLAVPGHMFDAVLMGYFYSIWHLKEKAAFVENTLRKNGAIRTDVAPFTYKKEMWLTLLVPVAAHGFYDFCCFVGTGWSTLLLIAFVIFLYIYCFRKIFKMSRVDAYENTYVNSMMIEKYPELMEEKETEETV